LKASLVVDYHQNNKIFDLEDKNVNRDNYAYSIWLLKTKLKENGIDLSTCDINLPLESDVSFCFDLPSTDVKLSVESSYLFLFESEIIKPFSWDFSKHSKFCKVFTWHDDLVDNKKYFKINFSHKFPENEVDYRSGMKLFEDKKLCTLIAGNKIVEHPQELYSERVKTIRWFEMHVPDSFDLYGIGWENVVTKNRYIRIIARKLPFVSKLLGLNFSSYKGKVESKLKTLSQYKFAICYENAQMIPGYITEKIFDCFFAGCVPIYWGAPNITDHIPESCFIDRRKFDTHEELYAYLTAMTKQEYLAIQENIENYLFSSAADPYRAETFANIIVEHVKKDTGRK